MAKVKIDPVQESALQAISLVENGHHVQAALDRIISRAAFSDIQNRQCTDWVYTFLRFQPRMEWILGNFLDNPAKLPHQMFLLLELGLVSMFMRSSKPDYAIVACTVELIKKRFGNRLAGVANACLRNIRNNAAQISDPDWYRENGDLCEFAALGVYHGIPAAIGQLWKAAYGNENALNLMRRSSERPWKGIRFNKFHPMGRELRDYFFALHMPEVARIGSWGVVLSPAWQPDAIMGKTLEQWVKEGAGGYQAAGSMLVLEELGITSWQAGIWDACAGIGGKTLALLNYECQVQLFSDTSKSRLRHFIRNCGFAGEKRPQTVLMDASKPALAHWHGGIIADVPCSGLGVLARRPELRMYVKNFSKRLEQFEHIQKNILLGLTNLLEAGQKLAYLTCTLNPGENERNIEFILQKRPELQLEKMWQTPHGHEWLEGMFGAVLIKK